MAKITAKNAIVVFGGYSLTTLTATYEATSDMGKVDVTAFTEPQNFVTGLKVGELAITAFWDRATGSSFDALKLMPSTAQHVTILPEGYALGNPSISIQAMQANFSPAGAPGDAIQCGTIKASTMGVSASIDPTQVVGIEFGIALQHGTITATTTGSAYDRGAARTSEYGATLHIWSATTTDTYIIKVQHSASSGSGYTDLVTFTANGKSITSERVANYAAVERYLRVLATRTGAAADTLGFTIHFWNG